LRFPAHGRRCGKTSPMRARGKRTPTKAIIAVLALAVGVAVPAGCDRPSEARAARKLEDDAALERRAPEAARLMSHAEEVRVVVFGPVGPPRFASVLETGPATSSRMMGREVAAWSDPLPIADLALLKSAVVAGRGTTRFEEGFDAAGRRALLVSAGERRALVFVDPTVSKLRIAVALSELWDLDVPASVAAELRERLANVRTGR
jgi:hypothetical protein